MLKDPESAGNFTNFNVENKLVCAAGSKIAEKRLKKSMKIVFLLLGPNVCKNCFNTVGNHGLGPTFLQITLQ